MHGSAVFLKTLLVLINKTICQSVDEQYCERGNIPNHRKGVAFCEKG